MWISRSEYQLLLNDRLAAIAAIAETRAIASQNAVHVSTLDWMRVRINQLEKDRAALLFQATGARMSVPEIMPTEPDGNPLLRLPTTFEDIGDDLASAVGIYHNPDGTLRYGSANETLDNVAKDH
jgi:hypothetical protein